MADEAGTCLESFSFVTDLGLIPVWLLVIAIATAVQAVIVVVAAVVLVSRTRQLTETVERIERDQLAPLVTRVHMTLDDMHEIAGRARSADEDVRRAVSHATAEAARTAVIIRTRLWPALGLVQAANAAIAAFIGHRRRVPSWTRRNLGVRP